MIKATVHTLPALLLALGCGTVPAQDIEPRRWTPLPIGTTVVGIGYGHTAGDISVDPLLNIEEGEVEARSRVLSVVHGFSAFGKTARVDVRLPWRQTRWKGLLDGVQRAVARRGPGDPRVRLSVNLLGPPAMDAKSLRAYQAAHRAYTIAGAALAVTLPLGEYQRDKLLNLGENRFTFRPQVGVVHRHGPWSVELTGSAFLFTDNTEFRGRTRSQEPLFGLQGHLVYTGKRGWWLSTGAAHAWGGESSVDGIRKDDAKRDLLFGVSTGLPLTRRLSAKIGYVGSRKGTDIGSDTDSIAAGFSFRF
jgi:hypothetical protein